MTTDTIYKVYWIRKPEHTDPHQEGYVGITNNVQNRLYQHKRSQNIIGKALKKYDDLIVEVLHNDILKDEALLLEGALRPHELIGWNICAGGGMPVSQKGRKKSHSKQSLKGEHRTDKQKLASAKRSQAMKNMTSHNKGKPMSQEQKDKISAKLTGRVIGPPSEAHRLNLSKVARNRPKVMCQGCGKISTKQVIARYHKECYNG